ncbi:zinc finger protein on ecdysone puffs-like isoform X2 [Anopheles cruzii]|uniref:zinc finger protein on ecdysone puffs-like isoform X2 n=1 Tax=Anopheles cruzii TaxID=68878 RepID=UPI0022EC48BB|nr:zinc finger protein on ecdysone puffs-like isoform X2 [Anopheles cruzii]
MAYRNNNRRGGGGGSSGGIGSNFSNNYGNRINPWDAGVSGGRGNNDAITFANSLINNLLRNQNTNQVPSLLDGVQSSRFDDINGYNFIRNDYISRLNLGYQRRNPIQSSNNSKNKNSGKGAKKSNANSVGVAKEKSTLSKASPYLEVSNDFLYCHMCDKHMYDATSFENHITGRTHRVMKESIEESYRMRATLLRQEARIAEQLKTIEIDRLKRMGKAKNYYKVREYCPMCELFFYGHIIAHRRSEKHLDLKKFLHPKCDDCELEFHNRTEYDDHLLSIVHMKNCKSKPSRLDIERKAKQLTVCTMNDELQDIREETAPKKKKEKDSTGGSSSKKADDGKISSKSSQVAETSASTSGRALENEEPTTVVEDDPIREALGGDSEGGKLLSEDAGGAVVDDSKLDEDIPEDEVVKEEESEDCILDYKPGDEIAPEIDNKLPRYKKNRALGMSLIGKLECIECCICHKYFDNVATGEVHARTHSHYRAFIRFLNEKAMEVRIAQKRAAVALEEAEAAKKKQKLIDDKTGADGCIEQNGEGDKKDSELYDPSEATESGDASMAEDSKSDDGENGSEQIEPMETELVGSTVDSIEKNDLSSVSGSSVIQPGANPDEQAGSNGEDSSKEEESKERDDKCSTKHGGGNRRGRGGRHAGRN